MTHHILEEEIHELEERLKQVEEKLALNKPAKKQGFAQLQEWLNAFLKREWSHVLGSFLFTVSFLGLLLHWLGGQNISIGLSVLFLVSTWLILKDAHFIKVSESTRQLLLESYPQKRISSQKTHAQLKVRRLPVQPTNALLRIIQVILVVAGSTTVTAMVAWLLSQYVLDPAWRTLLYLLFPFAALFYALYNEKRGLLALVMVVLYGVLVFTSAPLFSALTAFLVTVALASYFYQEKMWDWIWILCVAGYALLLRWSVIPLVDFGNTANSLYFAFAGIAFFFFVFFNALFVSIRRNAPDRQTVRAVIFTNGLGFFTTLLALSVTNGFDNWIFAALITIVVSICFGYIAWLLHERMSHAKYYYIVAVVAAFLAGMHQGDYLTMNLAWFAISVILLGIGFILNSYTARSVGLLALIVALSHYFLYIVLPSSGAGLLPDSLGVGGLHIVFLYMVSRWYQDLSDSAPEAHYKDNSTQIIYLAITAVVFGMISTVTVSPWQTCAWVGLGLLAWYMGRTRDLDLLQAVGVSLTVVAFGKLSLSDSLLLSPVGHATVLGVFGLFLILVGYLLWRYPKQFLHHPN